MADNIVDNSPEMDLDDPKLAEFLAAASGDAKPEPKVVKTDVKPKPAASSVAETTEEADAEVEETPDELRKQVEGLKRELARRHGSAERVDALEAELQGVKEKLAKPAESEFTWIRKLDDDGLSTKQTDWDDELADARAKYGRAEEAGDDRAMERQGQRILTAKKTLSAFRKEALDRTRRNQEEAQAAHTESQSIQSEIADMRDAVTELMPDLLTQDSEAWKAGNEEFISHPQLMARLGPLGEVVAAAMAVIRNPELANKKATPAARREVIGGLEKAIKKSLSTGASSPSTNRSVDYAADIASGDGLARFNAMIDKIKGG